VLGSQAEWGPTDRGVRRAGAASSGTPADQMTSSDANSPEASAAARCSPSCGPGPENVHSIVAGAPGFAPAAD
jgi:hypothetical protein